MNAKIDVELELSNSSKTTLVSLEDLDKIFDTAKTWLLSKRGYIQTRYKNYKTIMLHRLITNCPGQLVVNHIDSNPLNNTRDNLECISHGDNIHKQKDKDRTNMKSKYKGVILLKGRYYARIKVDNKMISGGVFLNEDEAGQAAKGLFLKYRGTK